MRCGQLQLLQVGIVKVKYGSILAAGAAQFTLPTSDEHTPDSPVQLDGLRGLPLLSCLTDDQLAVLSLTTERRKYLPHRPIILAGQSGDGLYVILAGRVRVSIEGDRGRELMLYTLGPGEMFGEVALVDSHSHSTTFQAQTRCEVLFIPATAFTEYVCRNADAVRMILSVMAHRRRMADRKIYDLAFTDVYARVVATLMAAAPEEHADSFMGPGCQEIAASVAATREMVNRVVKDMIERGVVKRLGRRLLVIDPTSLAKSARPRSKRLPLHAAATGSSL